MSEYAVSQRWSIALIVLFLLPCRPFEPVSSAASPAFTHSPWGDLSVTPIVISPPVEYVPAEWGPIVAPRWTFPHVTRDDVAQVLTTAGLTRDDVNRLIAIAKPDADHTGVTVDPSPALVRKMDPKVRARLYLQLSKSPQNFYQLAAFRFFGASIDDWLGADGISPHTRKLVDPLIYRLGDFMYFADLELVRAEIGNGPELQRLVRRLLSQTTMLVTLRIDNASQIDSVDEYWGLGGRRTDIRPLLESISDGAPSHSIDVMHLLPDLAQGLLYRYPKIRMADLEKRQLANCFWTALNFFNEDPDDRFLDTEYAMAHLKQDYYLVQDGFQLGDIVAFSNQELNVFHVAVYLADDLVFTKNGSFDLAPWIIMPIERLKGYYVEHVDNWRVTYYRKKDL